MVHKTLSVALLLVISLSLLVGCETPTKQMPKEYQEISGVVTEIEYLVVASSINDLGVRNTIVTFEDGRVKAFNGISNAVFKKQAINVITFNEYNNIISVEIQ